MSVTLSAPTLPLEPTNLLTLPPRRHLQRGDDCELLPFCFVSLFIIFVVVCVIFVVSVNVFCLSLRLYNCVVVHVIVYMYVYVHVCTSICVVVYVGVCVGVGVGVVWVRVWVWGCVLCKESTQLLPKNEEVLSHRILRKGCKAVGPEGVVYYSRKTSLPQNGV